MMQKDRIKLYVPAEAVSFLSIFRPMSVINAPPGYPERFGLCLDLDWVEQEFASFCVAYVHTFDAFESQRKKYWGKMVRIHAPKGVMVSPLYLGRNPQTVEAEFKTKAESCIVQEGNPDDLLRGADLVLELEKVRTPILIQPSKPYSLYVRHIEVDIT